MNNTAPLSRVITVLAGGIIAISFAAILIRWCEAPALVIAFYRLLIAALFFWLTSDDNSRSELRELPRTFWAWGLLSGIALALHFATWITSLSYTSVTNSVVLVATSPLFVALGARLILREPVRPLLYWGLLLAFAGAIIITLNAAAVSSPSSLWGNALALAGAVFVAVYFLIGRRLRQHMSTAPYVILCYSAAAAIMLVITFLFSETLTGYSLKTYSLFVLIALVPQVIGHTSFNWALRHLSAPTVTVALLGEPIGASVLAYIFLEEKLGGLTVIGGSLTLAGVILAIFSEGRKS